MNRVGEIMVSDVQIVHKCQAFDADLSYLGEYVSTYSPGCIDRQERGDMERGQHRYWQPGCNHYPHNPSNWSHVVGDALAAVVAEHGSAELADAAYVERDYARMEDFGNGWQMVGVYATATYVAFNVVQTVRSSGVWGVESDSADEFMEELARETLAELRAELRAIGATEEELDQEFADVALIPD